MKKLIKSSLRYHTFGKPFFAAAAVLLFLGLKILSNDAGSLCVEAFSYGLPFMCAVVMLNAGDEHTSGGFRNKAVAGYTKAQIFLSQIISSMICATSLFMFVGLPILLGVMVTNGYYFVFIFLMIYNFSAVVCACFAMLARNTVVAMVTVLLIGGLFVFTVEPVFDILNEPEYEIGYTIDYAKFKESGAEGSMIPKKIDNNGFCGGAARKFLRTAAIVNPFLHIRLVQEVMDVYDSTSLTYLKYINPESDEKGQIEAEFGYTLFREYKFYPLVSAAAIVIASSVGLIIFRKKELV